MFTEEGRRGAPHVPHQETFLTFGHKYAIKHENRGSPPDPKPNFFHNPKLF